MKLKPVMPLVVCAVTLLVSDIQPAQAANPTSGASASQTKSTKQAWPKWYYYDYLGMREWHKGNKRQGLAYLDLSYKLAEASCGNSRGSLDNYTKKLLGDVIEHQTFHLTEWREVPREKAENMNIRELLKRDARGIPQQERERQWKFLDKLSRFAQGTLGKKHYVVQRLEASMEECIPPAQPDEPDRVERAMGNGLRGRVYGQTPKWWREQDSDISPEMFTRDRKRLHQAAEPQHTEKKINPSAEPTTAGKGFVYIAGQKYDRGKTQTPGSQGWGGNSTVGSAARNDNPNDSYTGWGTQNQGADYRATPINKWGIAAEEKGRGGNKVAGPAWGQQTNDHTGPETGSQNTWGASAGVGQDPEKDVGQTGTYAGRSK